MNTKPAPKGRSLQRRVSPPVIAVMEAIVEEAMSDRHGDLIGAADANPDAHVEVTLTVREVRVLKGFLRRANSDSATGR